VATTNRRQLDVDLASEEGDHVAALTAFNRRFLE